jgi:hypothetical protein
MRPSAAIAQTLPEKRATARVKWLAIVAVLLTAFIGANAHLVYVAIRSQPECVVATGGDATSGADLRPAKPAC